jgi:hypothetical protein
VRRVVLLSSLTVGRCFTLAESPAEFAEDERAGGLGALRTIIAPEEAWRVVQVVGDEIEAQSASSVVKRFPAGLKVVEIPRQGWERLVERVRAGG